MKLLRRIAFSWIAGISLLLFLANGALWPVSHWRRLDVNCEVTHGDLRHDVDSGMELDAVDGSITVGLHHELKAAIRFEVDRREQYGLQGRTVIASADWYGGEISPRPIDHEFRGFGYSSRIDGGGKDEVFEGALFRSLTPIKSYFGECRCPLWTIILIEAVIPALYARSALKYYRRQKYGLCANCNYDLRASGETCPECGTKRTDALVPPRRIFTEVSLALTIATLVVAAALWAFSDARALQLTIHAPRESIEYDIDRSVQLTISNRVLVVSGGKDVVPLNENQMQTRQEQGTSEGAILLNALWFPRDEDGNFGTITHPTVEPLFHQFGYTVRSGERGLSYLNGEALPVKWCHVAFQCPLWSVVLLSTLFPLYKLLRIIFTSYTRSPLV
jgi:hypothetical protein